MHVLVTAHRKHRHNVGVIQLGTALRLKYTSGASNSDVIEIWYDGHDRFNVTVTVPNEPMVGHTVIGPVVPGSSPVTVSLPSTVSVVLTSVVNDPRNGDNLISIIFNVPAGQHIPVGDTVIALTGSTVINGLLARYQ